MQVLEWICYQKAPYSKILTSLLLTGKMYRYIKKPYKNHIIVKPIGRYLYCSLYAQNLKGHILL